MTHRRFTISTTAVDLIILAAYALLTLLAMSAGLTAYIITTEIIGDTLPGNARGSVALISLAMAIGVSVSLAAPRIAAASRARDSLPAIPRYWK